MATPPRAQFVDIAGYTNPDGVFAPVTTTRVTVYLAVPYAGSPLTTLATLRDAETGSGTPGNPFDATTGEINFWAAPGSYDIKIEDLGSPAKFATKYIRWDSIPGDKGLASTMITDSAITNAAIAADAVTATDILDGTVGTAELAAAAVTLAKMAADSVDASKIVDASVGTAELATNAVTTAKITDANVTTAKIADANVTLAKLAADSVNSSKIVSNSIVAADVAVGAFLELNTGGTSRKIAFGNSATGGFNGGNHLAHAVAHGLGGTPVWAIGVANYLNGGAGDQKVVCNIYSLGASDITFTCELLGTAQAIGCSIWWAAIR